MSDAAKVMDILKVHVWDKDEMVRKVEILIQN